MTTTYTFDNLIDDVKKEAQALRVHATEEERGNINIRDFDPASYDGCIYGMATGSCHSERAAELIEKCCVRFFLNKGEDTSGFTAIRYEGFKGIAKRVISENISDLFESRAGYTAPKYFSAIEAYILLPEAKNANLIAYLRGETNDLDL